MAQKKVFKGTINGVEFNNVQEYNAEMTRLINEGKDVNASSQTTIENVEENVNSCDSIAVPVRMLPGFDIPNVHYINNYIGEDTADNVEYVGETEENLTKLYPLIVKNLEQMDQAAVEEYYKDVTGTLSKINTDKDSTVKALAHVEKEIENLETKWQVLDDSSDLIDVYHKFYAQVKDAIENRLDKVQTKEAEAPKVEEEPTDLNANDTAAIRRLFKAIFGPEFKM